MAARGLLIYDGDCGFCTSTARWYQNRAGSAASITPWQVADLASFNIDQATAASAVVYVAPNGQHAHGADACAQALLAINGPWRLAGHFLALPGIRHAARAVYPVIARNRHHLPGATDACRLDHPGS